MIHYPNETIIVKIGNMELHANAEVLMLTYLKAHNFSAENVARPAPSVLTPPRVGEVWQGHGGIYSGTVKHRAGGPGYHLITGPSLGKGEWEKMKGAAIELEFDGHNDFSLPFRDEMELQYANIAGLFEKGWHWSCEQHAGDADYAWIQGFTSGYQSSGPKSHEFRARAVRRELIIQ